MKKTCVMVMCLVFLVLAGGCQTLKQLVKKPQVTFDGVTLTDATLFQGTLEFSFDMTNPNPVGFKLDEITYRLDVEGKTVLEGSQEESLVLRALGTEKVGLPLTVNYFETVESLIDLFGKKSLAYQVSGTFRFGTFSIPYSYSDSITLPKPPTVSLKDVHVKSLGLTGASLLVTLDVVNDNPCTLDLKTMKYGITLGGFRLLEGQTEDIKVSEDQKSRTIKVPVSLNFLAIGKGVMGLLTQGSLDYEISGDMVFDIPKFGPKQFPYTKKGQVGVTR